MSSTTTKQFVETRPHSGYSIKRSISGYIVERWSTAYGDLTDQAWAVPKALALRFNPHSEDWAAGGRGARLLRHCVTGGAGVKVLRAGTEVRK